MRRSLRQIRRLLLATAFLFVALALARAGFVLVRGTGIWRQTAALVGFLGAVGVFSLGFRWRLVYVFGHELTHWLAAKLCRRRTGAFRVGSAGGQVAIERPNAFIILAPYFVPLYSLVWIGSYGVFLAIAGGPSRGSAFVFALGLGASYGFHVASNAWVLGMGQKDLEEAGWLLSWAVILSGNLAVLFLAALVASGQWGPGVSLLGRCLREQGRLLFWLGHQGWRLLAAPGD